MEMVAEREPRFRQVNVDYQSYQDLQAIADNSGMTMAALLRETIKSMMGGMTREELKTAPPLAPLSNKFDEISSKLEDIIDAIKYLDAQQDLEHDALQTLAFALRKAHTQEECDRMTQDWHALLTGRVQGYPADKVDLLFDEGLVKKYGLRSNRFKSDGVGTNEG